VTFSLSLVCPQCGEPCETVAEDGRCLVCVYKDSELPAGEVQPGARVHLEATPEPPA
jgi:hypothetical protein